MKPDRLASISLLAYAAPAVPLSILTMPLIIYLPTFYAKEIGLGLTALGMIFFLARAWDGVVDPIIGIISDSTNTRWGRRKPWLLGGMPLLVLLTYALFQPPENAGLIYLLITIMVFYMVWTTIQIPYISWGVELSRNYRERTRITAYREGGLLVGTLLATGLPLILLSGRDPSLRSILFVFAVVITILLPVSIIVACKLAPQGVLVQTNKGSIKQSLRVLKFNKPLQRVLAGTFLMWLGVHVYNATVIFLVEHTLKLPLSSFLWFVFWQFLLSTLLLPVLINFAGRFGKHRVLSTLGMGFFLPLPLFLLIEPGSFYQGLIVYLLKGLFTGFIWVIPPALLADTVEYGMMKGGRDDPAVYMSVYYFMQKLALALSVAVALPVASLLGFDPLEVTSEGVWGLNFVSLFLSTFIAALGAAILFNYPLTEKKHDTIVRWLARRGKHA